MHKRSLGWITIKIHNEIKGLKVPTYESQLAPKTSRDYASVIEWFEYQLEGSVWNHLPHGQQAYETAQKKGQRFIELYDHTHIADNVREFLEYFVPRKVLAGNEFILKTCPRVIRKLLRWMRAKQLVEFAKDEIKDMCANQLWEDTVRDMGV